MIRIPLHAKNGELRGHAVVDDEDGHLAGLRWHMNSQGYAAHNWPREDGTFYTLKLHRAVLGLRQGDPLHVDHINRDRLDNRRENLRTIRSGQNAQNVPSYSGSISQYRGVTKCGGRWRARARLNGVLHHIGYFKHEHEAGVAAARWRAEHMPFTVEELV